MSLFDSTTIARFSQEAEDNFANEYPCILTRSSLTITKGTSVYDLPDSVRSIRRITWKGFKLDPLGQRNMREVFQSATQQGKPYWYVFNNIGANKIQFFPIPDTDVNPSSSSNLWGSSIPTDVIVEYYTQPNYTTLVLPSYFRRRLLKSYVLKMCFNIEGQGQNQKNSQYFDNKWDFLKQLYGNLIEELHGKSRKLCLNGITSSQFFPGQPLLPISRFGISIGDEF